MNPTATMGRNWKWIVLPSYEVANRAMLTEIFGAQESRPAPTICVFTLPAGENIGVFLDDTALTAEQARKGAWLELLVPDPAATAERLVATGVAKVPYSDQTHAYFQAPGGPVFRLARG